jgi:hypothetical protein
MSEQRTEEQQWRRDLGVVLAACIGGSAAWVGYITLFAERLP